MKFSRFLLLVSLLLMALTAQADDIDIYGVSGIGEGLKPNVLILLDNSGSMDENDVPGEPYDPNVTYSGSYSENRVYRSWWGGSWNEYFSDITSSNWKCPEAKTALQTEGFWSGRLNKSGNQTVTVSCASSGSIYKYRLGNYLNFLSSGGAYRIRMEVAKEVVANLIHENHEKVNFGLMAFNTGGNADNGGYIVAECGADLQTLIGSYTPKTSIMLDDEQNDYGAVGTLYSTTWTPLSETMAEAGLYFARKQSWFNGTSTGSSYPLGKYSYSCTQDNDGCQNYNTSSPIEFRCQKNYIILVTDGEPTHDDDKLTSLNYIINQRLTESATDGNSSYLDDVAAFLNANDLLPDMGSAGDFPDQTVTTYTIGFQTDQDLLESTASRGGGEYYTATSAAELGESLTNIIETIGQLNEMFTASTVPVSTADGVFAGDYIYLGLFQPTNQSNWLGNLKKYGLSDNLEILDRYGNVAANDKGAIFDNTASYWSTAADGPNVAAGGAGELLRDRATERVLYTYTGSNSALSDSSNLFTATNTVLTAATDADPPGLGLSLDDINAVHRGVAEDWPLGSLLHFQPLVEHYDIDNDGAYDGASDKSVIFVGGNDGLLHCFDDSTGAELWGFIPPDLLPNINLLTTADDLLYFVDGNASLYHYDDDGSADTPDKKLLIFGQRRGGFSYNALDVSNHSAPLYKYSIDAGHLGSGQEVLGQSWAEPQLCRMGYMDNSTYKTKEVFFLSGGYDINQDKEGEEKAAEDSTGRAVFAIDAKTGALFSNCLFSHSNYAAMTHSIIGATAYPSPYTGTSTRIYAGDLNGNLFAFRDDIFHRNRDASKSADFEGKYDGQEDGNWEQKIRLYTIPAGLGRKIWYSPRAVNEDFPVDFVYPAGEIDSTSDVLRTENRIGDYVFFGTGDRSRPNDASTVDSLYAIKNNWQWPSANPTIIEAYIDETNGGKIKAKSDHHEISESEFFSLDVTEDRIQNQEEDEEVRLQISNYVKKALRQTNNRGWFIRLTDPGEKLVARPIVRSGAVIFTTFVPEAAESDIESTDDPCASPGSSGNGWIYAIDYETGAASFNMNEANDEGNNEVKDKSDRRKKISKSGIPPEPTFISKPDADYVMVGTELVPEITDTRPVKSMFWRQLNRN